MIFRYIRCIFRFFFFNVTTPEGCSGQKASQNTERVDHQGNWATTGLHKTTLGSSPASQVEKSGTTVGTDSLKPAS